MASTQTSLINHNFGGIRRKDSMFSENKITCSDCQNVELFYTELNSGVGIRTAKGNVAINDYIPDDEIVIGIYEALQDGNNYLIVYAENQTTNVGKLYYMDFTLDKLTLLTENLEATGEACGVNMTQGWVDVFIFSNGKNIKYIYSDTQSHNLFYVAGENDEEAPNKLVLDLVDDEGREVNGLGLVNAYGRLWLFNKKVLWYSQQGAIGTFNNVDDDTSLNTRAGYIEFSKDITAIHEYLGALAVFHKNSSVMVKSNETTLFALAEESPGGCASYNSLVFHGTDLFFYDDQKKGVFSFQQIINGDKTLGDNIAYDIQQELMSINPNRLNQIRALSVVTSDRNEVWFLVPIDSTYTAQEPYLDENEELQYRTIEKEASIVMIYDYIRGEWVKRKCQRINSIAMVDSVLYSAGKQIYMEYLTNDFNGDYIQDYYKCTTMNLGTDNTLKITKFPPRLTIDASFRNHFFVQYVKNYNIIKEPKTKELFSKTFGNVLVYDSGRYDSGATYQPGAISGIIKLPSATFKALEITFYTNDVDQEFTIKAFEFSRIKVKQI